MIVPPGYFCRNPELPLVKFAFTNYGVSIGLQAVRANADRVRRVDEFFDDYPSGDEYDRSSITHVMACCSWLPGNFSWTTTQVRCSFTIRKFGIDEPECPWD